MNSFKGETPRRLRIVPSLAQQKYLKKGAKHRWGRLPLFDEDGQRYADSTISSCFNAGWIVPAYEKDFMKGAPIFALTDYGHEVVQNLPEGKVIPFRRR